MPLDASTSKATPKAMLKLSFSFCSAALLLLLLLPLTHAISSSARFYFHGYSTCARQVLYNLAPVHCKASPNITDSTICLCTTDGFLIDGAIDIFQACGCADLGSFADTIVQKCDQIGHPSIVKHDRLIKSAIGKSTCDDGLDGSDIAGIVIGVVVAVLVVVLGCLQFATHKRWIDKRYEPWLKIKECLCSCRGR